MVINSTNINKTNNQLSFELTELKKRPQQMKLEIQVLAWDRHKYVAGLNQLMGSQRSNLDNWNLFISGILLIVIG